MNKRIIRIMALALLLALVVGVVPAMAASRANALTLGKWYKSFAPGDSSAVYKVKFTEDKIVTFKWKGLGSGAYIAPTFTTVYPSYLFNNVPRKEYDPSEWGYYSSAASGTKTFVVAAGTYYVFAYEDRSDGGAAASQFCVTAKTLGAQPTNYTPSRAKALKAGARATLRVLPREAHHCWYRITLPKNQILTITRSSYLPIAIYSYDDMILLYDSENYREWKSDFKTTKGKITSKYKLDKGVYYVRAYPFLDGGIFCYFANDVCSFKWK